MRIDDQIASKDSLYYMEYQPGTPVTLTAEPDEGYAFDHYDVNGTPHSTPSLQLTINCAVDVDARFTSIAPHSDDDGGNGCFISTALR